MVVRRALATLTDPAWPALLADLTPQAMRGRVYSLLEVLAALSGSAGSMAGGYLFNLNPALPFWAFIHLCAAELLVPYLIIREPERLEE